MHPVTAVKEMMGKGGSHTTETTGTHTGAHVPGTHTGAHIPGTHTGAHTSSVNNEVREHKLNASLLSRHIAFANSITLICRIAM